jgi:hypothetical protein
MRFPSSVRAASIAILAAGCNQIIGLDPGLDKPDAGGGGTGGGTTSSSTTSSTGTTSTPMVCSPGTMMACYMGPAGTAGVGNCKAGQVTCKDDGSGYGDCEGQVLPATEDCAKAGDEDCDGIGCSDLFWANLYGDASAQNAQVVATDAAGNVVVAGTMAGSTQFGMFPLLSAGGNDVFVVKLDPKGNVSWAKRYGDAAGQFVDAIAVDSAGNIILGGHFNSTIDFGNGTLTSAGGLDGYVAKLSPNGDPMWSVRIGDAAAQMVLGVAVLPTDDVVIAGEFTGTVTFGSTTLSNSTMVNDTFVARLSGASGAAVWAHSYADSGTTPTGTVPQAVATDAAGHVIVGGTFGGTVSFGGTTLTGSPSKSIFLAELDASGAHVWSKSFLAAQVSFKINSVSVAPGGEITIAGQTGGSVDFGGGATGTGGLYAARFDATGAYRWARVFGGTNGSTITAAVDGAGNVALAGGFMGDVDFSMGASPLMNTGAMTDTFVAKLSPTGAHLWSKMFADTTGPDAAKAVAADPVSQRVVVVGQQTGSVDYGGGALAGFGGGDALVMEFQP